MQTLTKKLMITAAIIGLPASAWAAMAVIDTTAISKQIDQLTKMQEQTTIITDMRDKMQSQIDAIGEAGNINISVPNVDGLGSSVKNNLSCLKPDLPEMMPEVDFGGTDVDALDLCGRKEVYQQTLYGDKATYNGLTDSTKRNEYIAGVKDRRQKFHSDSIDKGLALSDVAAEETKSTNEAADELQAKANGAKDERTQLQVLIQSNIALLRAQSQTNQLLAALLKLQSSDAVSKQPANMERGE